MLRNLRRRVAGFVSRQRDVDALYRVLYDEVHDLDCAREVRPHATAEAFEAQWRDLPEGEYLLSDPWFKANVDRILCEQELLLSPSWFKGKRVLDAGCGSGRWSYGFAKLGADTTSVDVNDTALDAAAAATVGFDNRPRFVKSSLEDLDANVSQGAFDLVFCWGVAHHCVCFNKVMDNLATAVRPGGILYLYLYGRESVSAADDLRAFRDRVAYNVLLDDDERSAFLLRKAHGDRNRVHGAHDIYAPLINRRFTLEQTAALLRSRGFTDVVQTIDHTEVFVRATRGDVDLTKWELPKKRPPYWFEGRHL